MSKSAHKTARTARAFWAEAPGIGALREHALAALGADEVQVETRFSAVSRGTEALVFGGHVPASEYQRMRCPHQAGDFPFPVKYGYVNVGRVIEGSSSWLGQRVFCLYPHQTHYVVPEGALIPIPDAVPDELAVLAANMETALNAVWDALPRMGDRVSVVGGGVVGCLLVFLLSQSFRAEVELVDVFEPRERLARTFGADFASPERARRDRDLVFHASGRAAGLATALEIAAADTQVVELSWYGDAPVSLPLGGRFHSARLALRGSQVGTLSPNARARFDMRRRMELALSWCGDPKLHALIDEESAFEDLPRVMPRLTGPDSRTLCHRIRYF